MNNESRKTVRLFFHALIAFFIVVGALSMWASADGDTPAAWSVSNQRNIDYLLSTQNEVIGIEVLIAAGANTNIYSRWGHSMIRFVHRDGDWNRDSVVSFVARIDDPKPSYKKGLLGGYQVVPVVKTLGEFWTQYIRQENRPIHRYIIPTDVRMRQRILAKLESWIHDPSQIGGYTFLDNNCAGVLAALLEESGLPHQGRRPRIPTRIDRWLKRSLLTPYLPVIIETPSDVFETTAQLLEISTKQVLAGKNWPEDSADRIENHLSDTDIKRLLQEVVMMPVETRSVLGRSHNFRNGGATLEDTMSIKTIPREFYQLCDRVSCAQTILTLEQTFWNETDVNRIRKSRLALFQRYFEEKVIWRDDVFYSAIMKNQPLSSHFQMLATLDLDSEIGAVEE